LEQGKFSITREVDSFYLKSEGFNSCKDERDVREIATEILNKLNGLAKIHFGKFQPITIDSVTTIDEHGQRKTIYSEEVVSTMRFKADVEATLIKPDGTVEKSQPQPIKLFEHGFSIAKKDKNVAEALRIFGNLENNWVNLYKIYEIVLSDVGGKIYQNGWATKTDIDRFTQTAQSVEAVGDDARHYNPKKCPLPENPISLPEAKALIRTILEKWILSKCKSEKDIT
jgi:hypothetical protein